MKQILPATPAQKNSGWNFNINQLQDIKEDLERIYGVRLDLESIDCLLAILNDSGFLKVKQV